MIIERIIKPMIKQEVLAKESQAVIIYGPRQAGKTTLIKGLMAELKGGAEYFTGDDLRVKEIFNRPDLSWLKRAIGPARLIVIDEAQRIENIGLSMKLLIDEAKVTVLASGSASFDLANKISEPLTGRTKTFWLYPLAWQELARVRRSLSPQGDLEENLRFGMYPKVQTLTGDKQKQNYLHEYINNYLYQDILSFGQIRKPQKIMDLLSLLALQIGKEVSVSELGQNLALSQSTVQNYLDILEKMFVIINLRGLSRNLRKEIYKTSKYYFTDVGVRNAVIRNFNNLNLRSDAGDLFENWFIMERIKLAGNSRKFSNFYFWRTYDQQEIDLVEEESGQLTAYECKWSDKKKIKPPKAWPAAYPDAKFKAVTSTNFFDYLEK